MNMSKNEKTLLIIVATILIGILYYNFGYKSLTDKLHQKKQAKVEVETIYNKAVSDIETIEARESNVKGLTSKAIDKSSKFYPKILQDKLILEIDKLFIDSGIKGNINFSTIEAKEVANISPIAVVPTIATLDPIVTALNGNKSTLLNDNKITTPVEKVTGVNCEQLTATIAITGGSYEQLKKFLLSLEEYDRRIVVSSMAIAPKSNSEITGTFIIEFFGVPKVSDTDKSYLEWTLNNVYGKDSLFSTDSANGAYAKTLEEQNAKLDKNDFVAWVKSAASELSTFSMGLANDTTAGSYIYENKNDNLDVILELTEEDGKLYYKYSAGTSSKPGNGDSKGAEFKAKGEKIVLDISSVARVGSDDKSGIKLKVINNTKKIVDVTVTKDDSANPRVAVSYEGGTVNVINK